MKRRLGWWALAGLLVGAFWVLLSLVVPMWHQPLLWRLGQITCPIALFSHYAIKWYWAVVSNGVVYLLIGLVVEVILRLTHLRPASA